MSAESAQNALRCSDRGEREVPHRTPPNRSESWRRAVTTHMRAMGSEGEGDHFPWKVYVNQITGERVEPPSR